MKNEDIKNSSYVDSSSDVYSSRAVDSSRVVYSSRSVYSSSAVVSSRVVIFCYNIKCKEYYAFNKQVTDDRYYEIKELWNEIKGDFKLELKDNEWEDEWKKFPKEKWIELSKIPEFDKEIVEKIIGFELDLENDLKISDETLASAIKIVEASGRKVN